jgi:hypothetical protein
MFISLRQKNRKNKGLQGKRKTRRRPKPGPKGQPEQWATDCGLFCHACSSGSRRHGLSRSTKNPRKNRFLPLKDIRFISAFEVRFEKACFTANEIASSAGISDRISTF